MTLLAIVTFDLHGAAPQDYTAVKSGLARLRLEKQIRKKSSKWPIRLPANTFAAKFRGKWTQGTAGALRKHLESQVSTVITQLNLRATLFVVVGDGWSWGRKTI